MRAMSRAAMFVTAVVLLGSGTAYGAELPRGPVTAATVASAQAEATTAGTAATDAARAAAESGVRLDAAKAAATAAATKAAQTNDPADIAAAAAASAAQATAQQDFDAKTAASATAAAAKTAAEANASREAASFAKLDNGTSTESTSSLPDDTALPPVEKSDNVDYVGHSRGPSQTYALPFSADPPTAAELATYNAALAKKTCPAYNPSKCPGFSALNFIHYENLGYDFIVANGTPGMSIWSLKDPAHPKYVAGVNAAAIGAKTGEALNQFWEGENMTVDSRRKLAFLSKDSGTKGIVTIDVKDPWNPQIVSFQKTPLGHTATCLNDCRFIWQVGGGLAQSYGAKKSAVAVTDIRDPEHPFTYADVFEAAVRRTNVTGGSTHSVDVDFDGVAWVSGTGGARGWWTEGLHKDTVTGAMRYATPYDPLPYGGGPIAGIPSGTFMHNAYHVPQALGDQGPGDTMLITNENNNTDCASAGLFYIASLKGTRDVENNLPGAPVTAPAVPAQMERLASYSTNGKPGAFHGTATTINTRTGAASQTTVGDCSAHWFTVKGNIVALGNYEQGTRFVDISDPRNPQQVGYFRVPASGTINTPGEVVSSDTAASYWHGDYVYVSDYARGIDVLKFKAPKGDTQKKTCWNSCADNQTMTGPDDEPGGVGGSVTSTLALTTGIPAAFTAFTPGVAKDYQSQTTANVISTAGDAALSVADASAANTGHLVNGAFALPSALQAKATSPAGTGAAALADVGGSANPTSLLTYAGPTSNDTVTLAFQQHIGAGDALRTGTYSKTLTFTLSTTTP